MSFATRSGSAHLLLLAAVVCLVAACGGAPTGTCPWGWREISRDTVWIHDAEGDSVSVDLAYRVCDGRGL